MSSNESVVDFVVHGDGLTRTTHLPFVAQLLTGAVCIFGWMLIPASQLMILAFIHYI